MNDMETPNTPCQALDDLIPAYGMGICTPQEAREVERLLAVCPDADAARVGIAAYRALHSALHHSAPDAAPPAALKGRILQAARAERRPAAATVTPMPSSRSRLWTLASVAALALLALVNVWILSQAGAMSNAMDAMRAEMHTQTAMLTLLAEEDVVRFTLGSMDDTHSDTAPAGVMLCNPEKHMGVIHAQGLPMPRDGEYQVWLWRDGQRTDGGRLKVKEDGSAMLIVEAPQPMRNYQYVAVAMPEADAEQPPVLRGQLYE